MAKIQLRASDGHEFGAERLAPIAPLAPIARPRGGIVVIQEIFGVNEHPRGRGSLRRRRFEFFSAQLSVD